MGLIEVALSPLRAVIGAARRGAEEVLPVKDIEEIQERALGTVEAIKEATESIEAHVAVIETLARSVPPLTDAVEKLTTQLQVVTEAIAPVVEVEQEVSRFGQLFGHRRGAAGSNAQPSNAQPSNAPSPDTPPDGTG